MDFLVFTVPSQRLSEIHGNFREKTWPDPAIGREPDAITLVAEVIITDRGNETQHPSCVLKPEILGRAISIHSNNRVQLSQFLGNPFFNLREWHVFALPILIVTRRHIFNEPDMVGLF